MPNRRHFVRTIAGATAGLFAARGHVFDAEARAFQAGAARRREVSVAGKRIKVVDVHGHFIEPTELDVIKDTNLATNISSQLNGPLVLGPGRLRAHRRTRHRRSGAQPPGRMVVWRGPRARPPDRHDSE